MSQEATATAAEEQAMLDRIVTVKPTARVERLRESYLGLKPSPSIDRTRIETEVMRATEGEPMVTRRAKVFAAIARQIPIDIYPDELLVCYPHGGPRYLSVNPSPGVERGLERPGGKALYNMAGLDKPDLSDLSDEDKRVMKESLIPYWKGDGRWERTLRGRNCLQIPPELKDLLLVDPAAFPPIPTMTPQLTSGHHYGHNIPGYDKVLEKGFLGIKKDAENRLASLDPAKPEDVGKITFLGGVVRAMAGAAELGYRFAARARELEQAEADATRKAELLRIAAVCDRVPAHPAGTFHEALQSCYFAWLLTLWETNYTAGQSAGRMDQYLYPYYRADIRQGRITREEAQELIDCYLIKLNHSHNITALTVGGVKADGSDATNDLSYMFIEGVMHTRLRQPAFSVQVHNKMPDDLLIKACELCSLGSGHPQFLNNDVSVLQALARGSKGGPGITLADARSAAPIGCSEVGIPGKDSGYLFFDQPNLALALELVLTNGVRRSDNRDIGLKTGDPRQLRSFGEIQEAYRKQVAWIRRIFQISGSINESSVIELAPTPYESALIEGCIEKGICREEGGAHYNFNIGGAELGSSDAGDSLTAIKKLVFEDKKITMDQLCDALERNFAGDEELRQMLLRAPKFGNDNNDADEQVAWVLHQWVSEFSKLKNLRGGQGCPGASPMSAYVPAGAIVGALPSGRPAGMPLADAASPSPGNDVKGPTAVLKSMGKVDNVEILAGVTLNMRLDPAIFRGGDVKRLADLVRTFVDQKIYHLQINIVSSDTLRSAQEKPEAYRDLMVKVAGYNAFFTQLGKPLQDSIIARTSHGL